MRTIHMQEERHELDKHCATYSVVFRDYYRPLLFKFIKKSTHTKISIDKEARKEMEQLRKMRSISLTEPLAEKVRPKTLMILSAKKMG